MFDSCFFFVRLYRLQGGLSVGSTSTPLPTCSPSHTHSPRLSPICQSSVKHTERGFEPRNLLTLFDEASLESEP